MFRRNTVFIVGAGASKELLLPTGAELSQKISNLCEVSINRFGDGTNPQSNRILTDLKREAAGDTNKVNLWLKAMGEIRRALPFKDSIDAVIDQYHDRPEIAEVGKYMIARLIMEAESSSFLGPPFGQPGFANLTEQTWLHVFSRMLFEGLRKDGLDAIGHNISIICFNYDRCIERYLIYAISETYGLNADDAADLVARIQIVHAYGSLGVLPGLAAASGPKVVGFGGDGATPWLVSQNLQTFSESVNGDTDESIKALIRDADQYVYLGLSFGKQNMDLLSLKALALTDNAERSAYASGRGQFEQGRAAICRLIRSTYSNTTGVTIDGLTSPRTRLELGATAKELLDLHWHNILG